MFGTQLIRHFAKAVNTVNVYWLDQTDSEVPSEVSPVALVMSTGRPPQGMGCKVTGDGDAARTILMAGSNRVAKRRLRRVGIHQ
jgi:hypothetical protein